MKAIVVAGGDAVPEDAAQLAGAQLVIAADSGAQWLEGRGMRPDLVVGDMDSIDPELLDRLRAGGVAVEPHPAEKDASDAELAVERAAAADANEIVILGGLRGERLDHELANLLLLVDDRWSHIELRLVRGPTTARALKGEGHLVLEGASGDLVTLLAVGGAATGVSTHGLRYPLVAENLAMGRSRGLSNEVEEAPASVSLQSGTLLVIETRKEPSA